MRLFGVVVLCAKLALVPLVFDLSFDVPFTVPKVLLSHALAYVLGGVIIGLLIKHGRGFLVWSLLHVPVLAFLAVNVIATAFAADRVLGLYGAHVRMLGLGTVSDYVVLYFAVVLLIKTRAEGIVVTVCILAASVAVLGYEAVQLAGLDPFAWTIDGELRPFSTIGQSTSLAQYLVIVGFGVFAFGLLIEHLPLAVRLLAIAYSGVLFVGAVATGTRSGLIGFAAAAGLLILLIWILHPNRRARLVTGGLSGIALLLMAGVLILTPLGERVASTIEPVVPENADDDLLARLEPSAAGRAELYGTGFQMLRDRPWLGYGPDNFAVGVPKYRPERAGFVRQGSATSAHSWLVHVAVGSGLLGLGTFIAIPVVAVILVLRSGFRPLAIAGMAMLAAYLGTGITTINDIVGDSLFWAAAGMVGSATASSLPRTNAPVERSVSRRRAPKGKRSRVSPIQVFSSLGFPLAGLALSLITLGALNASRAAEMSRDARLAGRVGESIDLGVQATRSDGGRAEYWDLLGLAYVASSRWHEAGAAFERASVLAPYDLRYMANLTQIQLVLLAGGDRSAATRALGLAEQAVRIDPNNPRAHVLRAAVMQATGNLLQADVSAQRAVALDPGSTNSQLYIVATQVAVASGRPADAVQIARQGVAALGLTIQSVPLRIELARALVAAGQRPEALMELALALSIQPNSADAQRLRAELLAGQR